MNGLQAGDWITGFNRFSVDDLETLQRAAEQQPARQNSNRIAWS